MRRGLPIVDDTHGSEWDAPGTRTVRAYCGVYIRRTDRQAAPTCLVCRAALGYLATLQIEEGAPDGEPPTRG